MKLFRLNCGLAILSIVASSVCSGWLLAIDKWAPAILLLLLCAICIAALYSLGKRLILTMLSFTESLEANDTSSRYDFGKDYKSLNELSLSMNRIMSLWHQEHTELETGKIYYDRVLKVMTHEMRNSMTPVVAISTAIVDNPDRFSDGEMLEAMESINGQCAEMLNFLEAYFALTRVPEPKPVKLSAVDFLMNIKILVDAELKSRKLTNDVIRFYVANHLTLSIDPALISQAIINLVRNALDAVNNCEHPKIELTVTTSNGTPFILIKDNGCGVPDNVKLHLFEPFFTTKPSGTGVGLAISRQIVRRHGGDIKYYDTTTTKGSSFGIVLPA